MDLSGLLNLINEQSNLIKSLYKIIEELNSKIENGFVSKNNDIKVSLGRLNLGLNPGP